MAIGTLIAGAAIMTIFQVINVTKSSNDRMTVIRQVQNAGYWISHDTLMAQNIVTVNDPETSEDEFITLSWTDWKDWEDDEDDEVHKIVYTFHDMDDGLKKLKRTHWIDDMVSKQTLVAEYIVVIDGLASFFEQDGVWKLTIQARSGAETETREYEINPRVNI